MTETERKTLQNAPLRKIAPLRQLDEVHIDRTLPQAERLEQFCAQIGNPYCFLCGGTPVKLRFAEDGEPLESILLRYFTNQKR